MTGLRALWSGNLPLGEAFWTWAFTGGLCVNMVTSLLFVVLIVNDLPLAALAVGYGLSLPYNIVATIGVWRAAARHPGPVVQADLARGAVLMLMAVLSLT